MDSQSTLFCVDSINRTEQEFRLSNESAILIQNSHDSSLELSTSTEALLQSVKVSDCFGLQIFIDLKHIAQKYDKQDHRLAVTLSQCINVTLKITNHASLSVKPAVNLTKSKNIQVEFVGFAHGVDFEVNEESQKVTLVWAKNEKELPSSPFEKLLPDAFVGSFNAETQELKYTLPLVYVSHESLERPLPVKVTAIKTRRQPPRFAQRTTTPTPTFYKMTDETFKSLEHQLNVENGYLSDEHGALIDPSQLTTGTQYILRGDMSPLKFMEGPLRRVGLLYDERLCLHLDPDEDNDYEQPSRITEIWRILGEKGLIDQCTRIPARLIAESEATLVHTKKYFSSFVNSVPDKRTFKVGSDIYFNEHTVQSALLACGSVVEMTERVLKNELDCGFAIVRPPGHHAERNKAEGFCFLNNCAVAAEVARRKYSLERILIVDWDVHHGQGIQHAFEDDNQVIYFSTHRYSDSHDFYPGTGSDDEIGQKKGKGFTINVPFSHSYNDADLLNVIHQVLMPIAFEFNPQLVIVAAGFDAVKDDPLGGCRVSPCTYGIITSLLQVFAGGKIVMALEGGYNLRQTAFCVAECLQSLLGKAPSQPMASNKSARTLSPQADRVIQRVKKLHAPYWSCMAGFGDKSKSENKDKNADELADKLNKMQLTE